MGIYLRLWSLNCRNELHGLGNPSEIENLKTMIYIPPIAYILSMIYFKEYDFVFHVNLLAVLWLLSNYGNIHWS